MYILTDEEKEINAQIKYYHEYLEENYLRVYNGKLIEENIEMILEAKLDFEKIFDHEHKLIGKKWREITRKYLEILVNDLRERKWDEGFSPIKRINSKEAYEMIQSSDSDFFPNFL